MKSGIKCISASVLVTRLLSCRGFYSKRWLRAFRPTYLNVFVFLFVFLCDAKMCAFRGKMREAALLLTHCLLVCLLLSSSQAARQGQDLRCGACRALVDEMEWAISQIDPKKMIQTGSFRINPDGSQSIREVPLARSEGNLLELMESICERMGDYGERTDPSTNRKSYVRIKSRSGEAMDLSEASLDSRVTASMKFACETIVEQHEDEIIEFFAHETDNVKDKLCSKRTDLCDHALKMTHDEL
ncbi:protein canopy homolog 2 isoform X1 [Astatotilapia calliptera]|nr:protein canopy homolog 2 isoform X1 [Astatotilapia calliptera]